MTLRVMTDNIAFLKEVEAQLKAACVLSPQVEAQALITHFARLDMMDLFTGTKKIGSPAQERIAKALIERRKGAPLFYLTGRAPFYGRLFFVSKDTLIPRPETELLVEETLNLLKRHHPPLKHRRMTATQPPQILDVGTGSGCVAVSLTLEHPACRMTALDASTKALKVARKNVQFFGLSEQIQVVRSRLFDSFGSQKHGFWDIIVSNPPYVPAGDLRKLSREVRSEPRLALDGGRKGLSLIREILRQAPLFLKPSGRLLLELGQGQSKAIEKILTQSKDYDDFYFVEDLNGIDRVLVTRRGFRG